MASVDVNRRKTSDNLNDDKNSFDLNENDVPGAALVKQPEQCTVAILKR
jgi:hypothetical protein